MLRPGDRVVALRFDLTIEPDGGPIWLELAGPPRTREFLSAPLES
jgi:hypothetical protein